MLKENLEQLFEFIAQHIPEEKVMQAKKVYQKTGPESFGSMPRHHQQYSGTF